MQLSKTDFPHTSFNEQKQTVCIIDALGIVRGGEDLREKSHEESGRGEEDERED